ncbi:MAG: GtrA family protein [Rhizobiales bacterium]|nr:GtrA family protein [Hyphomicrobiales bacterium]
MSGIRREILAFLVVGLVATGSHYAVLIFLVEAMQVAAVPASAAGAFLGAVVSYFLNRKLTFRSNRAHRAAMPRFFTVAALSLATNTGLMALFTGPLGIAYLPAQVVTTGFLIILTFGLNKLWTFRPDAP